MNIVEQAKSLEDFIAQFHHDIHMHPELGFQEFRTTQRLKEEIESLGLSVKLYNPTGLHVDIRGTGRGLCADRTGKGDRKQESYLASYSPQLFNPRCHGDQHGYSVFGGRFRNHRADI